MVPLNTSVTSLKNSNTISTEATGFEEQSHHNWTIDQMDLQLDIQLNATVENDLKNETNMTEDELNTLIDKVLSIPNSLQGARIDFFVGVKNQIESVAWIAPSLITTQKIIVPKELFALSPHISEDEAAELEFTLPKKSGFSLISPVVPFISPTLESDTSNSLTNMLGTSFRRLTSISALKQWITSEMMLQSLAYGFRYPYDELTEGAFVTPVPFTDTSRNLSQVGEHWKKLFQSQNFTSTYEEQDTTGTLTASGEITSEYGKAGIGSATATLDKLKSSYNLNNGILQNYQLDGSYLEKDNEGNKITASFSFEMSYDTAESFNFGVGSGDVMGFTFPNASIDKGLIDAINGTLQGNIKGNVPDEPMLEGILESTELTLQCTGKAFNGLGLKYNGTVEVYQNSTSGRFIGQPFGLSVPYVLPKWDIQHSYWQTYAHVQNKIIPNFLNSKFFRRMYFENPERVTINIDNGYSILALKKGGNLQWTSLKNDINVQLGYDETIEGKISKFDAQITGNTWYTYSGDGLLTEIGISLTIGIKYDSDEDNSLADESKQNFDIEISFNRVENQKKAASTDSIATEGVGGGTPNFDAPINPPDATNKEAGWEDVTPSREGEGPAPSGGKGIAAKWIYLGIGIAGAVVIIGVILALRRRKSPSLK